MSKAVIEMRVVMEQEIGDFDITNDIIRESLQALHSTMLRSSLEKDSNSRVWRVAVTFTPPDDINKAN